MEDRDWSDIPCGSMSIKHVEYQDILSDHSTTEPEDIINLENENSSEGSNKHASTNHVNICGKEINKPSNTKKEKECCSICLSSYKDRSFLDQCFHSFCFCCILQWCEVVQTCPLCKSSFASVIHNVKSMENYEQYVIIKSDKKEKSAEAVTYDEHGFNDQGDRFRYRTTRQARSRSESRTQRTQEENAGVQQSRQSWGVQHRRQSRNTRHSERNKRIEKRRQVYSYKLRAIWSSPNNGRKCRNITARFYKSNPACTHRLIPWILRDLTVLLGDNDGEVNFLMEFILSLIARIDMESVEFISELEPFLLQTTDHFVHELVMYAKSPFDMFAYDECVIYPWPTERGLREDNHENVNISEETPDCYVNVERVEQATTLNRTLWNESPEETLQVCESLGLGFQLKNDEMKLAENNINVVKETVVPGTCSSTLTTDDDQRNIGHLPGLDSRRIPTTCFNSKTNDERTSIEIASTSIVNDISQCILVEEVPEASFSNVSTTHDNSRSSPHQNLPRTRASGLDIPQSNSNVIFDSENKQKSGDTSGKDEAQCLRDEISHHHNTKRHKRHKHEKHKHKRRHKRKTKRKTLENGSSLHSSSRCSFNTETTSGYDQEPHKKCQLKSPTIEVMLEELDELNVHIQQHEKQLLTLGLQ